MALADRAQNRKRQRADVLGPHNYRVVFHGEVYGAGYEAELVGAVMEGRGVG